MIRGQVTIRHDMRLAATSWSVMRRQAGALLTVALLVVPVAMAVTDAERIQVYDEFRAVFDAKRYDDALPLAQKLVSLTEEQYGPADRALINPLSNLGTTYYRRHDFK